jgi:hypothetical protein
MHRKVLSHELNNILSITEIIKDAATKARFSSLISSLQYTLKEFFAHFDQDAESYKIERANQVFNHYDMYHSYFKKHLRHTDLEAKGRIVDRYLFACAKIAEMQILNVTALDAILKLEIVKLRLLEEYFIELSQSLARERALMERSEDDDLYETTVEVSSELTPSEDEEEDYTYGSEISVDEFLADELKIISRQNSGGEEREENSSALFFENDDQSETVSQHRDSNEDSGYNAFHESDEEEAEQPIRGILDSEEDAVDEAIRATPISNIAHTRGVYFCPSLRFSPTFYQTPSPQTPPNTTKEEVSREFDRSTLNSL